jgi:hypothetical protein
MSANGDVCKFVKADGGAKRMGEETSGSSCKQPTGAIREFFSAGGRPWLIFSLFLVEARPVGTGWVQLSTLAVPVFLD